MVHSKITWRVVNMRLIGEVSAWRKLVMEVAMSVSRWSVKKLMLGEGLGVDQLRACDGEGKALSVRPSR